MSGDLVRQGDATTTSSPVAAPTATPEPYEWVITGESGGGSTVWSSPSRGGTAAAVASAAAADAGGELDEESTPFVYLKDAFVVGGCYRSAVAQVDDAVPCGEAHQSEVIMICTFDLGLDAPYLTDSDAEHLVRPSMPASGGHVHFR